MLVPLVGLGLSAPFLLMSIGSLDGQFRSESRFRGSRMLAVGEAGTAWFLGMMFVCGGLSKLMPFPGFMGPVWLEEALEPHGLAMYARFIAWSEAIIGVLLLSKRTRLLGSIMMVPLLANILMVTVSMEWRGTPWIIMVFLFANVYLLVYRLPIWLPVVTSAIHYVVSLAAKRQRLFRTCEFIALSLVVAAPLFYALLPVLGYISAAAALLCLIAIEFASRYPDDGLASGNSEP